MKKLFLLFSIALLITSCDPRQNCTEPKCFRSDANTDLDITLTGKTDSIIYIGDTIRFQFELPDTLITNYGNIKIAKILEGSYFHIYTHIGDSIGNSGHWENSGVMPKKLIEFDNPNPKGAFNENFPSWNRQTKRFECFFIPNRKGKGTIEVHNGKVNLKASDGKDWQINTLLHLTNPKRYDQYLSWIPKDTWSESTDAISQKNAWYCFEVR